MALSKRKSPVTLRSGEPKTARLRPRPGNMEPYEKPAKPPAKKARKRAPKKEKQQAPFRLMDLAPELRILVYDKVLENHPTAKLSRSSRLRQLSSTSVLPRVSKQVRDEFLSVLITSVPEVSTVVNNFCFGHIITFLNRLSTIELEKMTSAHASRTLRITLEFPNSFLEEHQIKVDQLQRWLNRAEHPSKKGSTIDFQYVAAKGAPAAAAIVLQGQNIMHLEAIKMRSALQYE